MNKVRKFRDWVTWLKAWKRRDDRAHEAHVAAIERHIAVHMALAERKGKG